MQSPPPDVPGAAPRPPEDATTTPGAASAGPAPVATAILAEVLARLSRRQRPIERYDVEAEIARGGMGSIQRVWDEDLRRHLAMKVVLQRGTPERPDEAGQQRSLGRFIEEAQVTGQLDHPGIVPVHDLGIDQEGRAFFTMQLVRGRDLEALFKVVHAGQDEEWTQTRALNVLLRVCDAMAYAHAKGVIHRDLKPANVMSGRFGEVYVMDWGLARVLGAEDPHDLRLTQRPDPALSIEIHTARQDARDSERDTPGDSPLMTLDGDIIGTPSYMPPEQARGDLEAMGPASDIYSLGAMLYHLLSGHTPYESREERLSPVATWGLVQAGPPPALREEAPGAPDELVAICEKAMARQPGDRYEDMPAFGRDLRAYLEGRVVGAFEAGAVAEFRKWVSRNRALALTSFAAVLLIVTGLSAASVVLANKNEELREREREATASARIAEERAETILRLADGTRLEQLVQRVDSMWPAFPAMVGTYTEWLREADDLSGRLEDHRAELQLLRSSAARGDALSFASTEEEWHHDTLADLVDDLQLLIASGGLREEIRGRLSQAESIGARTIQGPEAEARWARAVASIASVQESPHYLGLALTPQLGLLPLGRDPRSQLWEFVDLQTGTEPERDPVTRELLLTEDSGLVFILIPGGSSWLGSQSTDRSEHNYVASAPPHEGPVHALSLAPFFLSKYELTQGQWSRFTGENPSFYRPGATFLDNRHDLLHPVERVSWIDSTRVLARLGMSLPSEAQWEYAARAGTETAWATGPERDSLEGYANLADAAAAQLNAPWPDVGEWPELDDGWAASSRVGSFEPNAFGLFDMHGNVWEWCADLYEGPYQGTATSSVDTDAADAAGAGAARVNRGGSFKHSAEKARCGYRNPSPPDLVADVMGVRPARQLTN